ncbi:MAG: hypothetical protein ACREB3_05035 [Burkholderiales bacterium]
MENMNWMRRKFLQASSLLGAGFLLSRTAPAQHEQHRMPEQKPKTGKPKASQRLQVAAYSAMQQMGGVRRDQYHRYFLDDSPVQPMPKVRDHYLLFLRPEGYELVPISVTAKDRAHFLALVRAYHRIRSWEND